MSTSHLSDDRLLDCCLASQAGEAVDPPTAEHLADCAACAARFGDWQEMFAVVRETGAAEVDALFPASALDSQRANIARRIERLGRHARVLAFPGRLSVEPRHPSRSVSRWVAAAAAIGLVVGGAASRLYGPAASGVIGPRARSIESQAQRLAPAVGAAVVVSQTDGLAEGLFLDELELALEGPRTSALLAFDTLTPQVREISAVVR